MKSLFKSLILPLTDIDQALPKQGTIVDLGCGEGIVSLALAHHQHRHIIGIDQNPHKVNLARHRAQGKNNLNFRVGDILNHHLPSGISACVISDVLHHLPKESHRQLLEAISHKLKRGGVLLVKEINAADTFRCRLSRLWDWLWYPHDQINYLSADELITIMKNIGFKVTHLKKRWLVPASVNLYIGIKQ